MGRERELSNSCCFQADEADGDGTDEAEAREGMRKKKKGEGGGARGSVLTGIRSTSAAPSGRLVRRNPSVQYSDYRALGAILAAPKRSSCSGE